MNARIQLTSEQQETLARLSAKSGQPWEKVLQEALASFEHQARPNGATRGTVLEAMERLGLLGCVTDAPPDLSSNPVHMEGFGSSGK
jgi:hypothetical protein